MILGGLVSSTLLDIVVTPAVFFRYGEPALAAFLKAEGAGSEVAVSPFEAGDGRTDDAPAVAASQPA